MIVDVDYHQYSIGQNDEVRGDSGPAGSVTVCGGGLLVTTFTQWGPLSLRILMGDYAPGAAEDSWATEWETVQDVPVIDASKALEVRTWEGGQSEPPSGEFARPGRWAVRFHARGEAKVEAEHRTPGMALEEHLILIWPAGADPGESPVWDEVIGVPSDDPWTINDLGEYTRIMTPLGYYRMVTSQHGPQAAAATPALVATDQPGLTPDGSGGLVVSTGTTRSCEITVEGSDQQKRDAMFVGGWQVVAETTLDLADTLRLVDGLGRVPRRIQDPLLPPGSWTFRLLTRGPDFEQNVIDANHVHDQRIQIWPRDAPVWEQAPVYRHYQVDEDGTRYLVGGLDPGDEDQDGILIVLIQTEDPAG